MNLIVNQDDLRMIYERWKGDVDTISDAEHAALEGICAAIDGWFKATELPHAGRIGSNMAIAYAVANLADEWQIAEWERP